MRSIAVLPLVASDEVVGVLALYASEPEFFHEEEMKLLTELAGDIGFAIDTIEKRERLNYLAYYDALTGLANRTLFLERVAQYMRSATSGGHQLALFLIDLERFKNINDSLGQTAGDALLKQVAAWLTRSAGDGSLLARVGADHFALVLPEVKNQTDVIRLLERTVNGFSEHAFRLNESIFRIAVKVGVAVFPADAASAEVLFANAEAALKKAKATSERYLFYTQTMTDKVAGQLTMENNLRPALEKREFVLHYQPKVNLESGKVTSAEALIRWNDPRTGLVPPGRFIPILEETGLINEVGRWSLRKAVEDFLRWRAAGLGAVRLAVNVSPRQLRNPGFVAEIKQALGDNPHACRGSGTRDHGKPDHGGCPQLHHHAAGDPRPRRHHRDRRLRHRFLLAQLPGAAARGHPQDRPLIRDRDDDRPARAGPCLHHHQPRAFPETQGRGRGC